MVKVYSKTGQRSLEADLDTDSTVMGLWDKGFINPANITGYHCSHCGPQNGSPTGVVDVAELHGQVVGSVSYSCTGCEAVVLREMISGEKLHEVPVKYIGEDPDFMFKSVGVEDMLGAAEEARIAAGSGDDYAAPLERAKLIAGKLDQELPERCIREIQEARSDYLHENMAAIVAGISMPSTYEEIPAQAYDVLRVVAERGVPKDAVLAVDGLTNEVVKLVNAEWEKIEQAQFDLERTGRLLFKVHKAPR